MRGGLAGFKPRNLANTVWAHATAGQHSPLLFAECSRTVGDGVGSGAEAHCQGWGAKGGHTWVAPGMKKLNSSTIRLHPLRRLAAVSATSSSGSSRAWCVGTGAWDQAECRCCLVLSRLSRACCCCCHVSADSGLQVVFGIWRRARGRAAHARTRGRSSGWEAAPPSPRAPRRRAGASWTACGRARRPREDTSRKVRC